MPEYEQKDAFPLKRDEYSNTEIRGDKAPVNTLFTSNAGNVANSVNR